MMIIRRRLGVCKRYYSTVINRGLLCRYFGHLSALENVSAWNFAGLNGSSTRGLLRLFGRHGTISLGLRQSALKNAA